MAEETFNIRIFERENYNTLEIQDKYNLKIYVKEFDNYRKPFDLFPYTTKATIIKYKVLGSNDGDKNSIEIRYKGLPFYFSDNSNTFDIKFYNRFEDYEFYIDGKLTKVNSNIQYGFINGIVDVQKCNVSEDHLWILCYRRADHSFIGEYKVTAGTYTIPNLDVNEEYDIVLFDKSMTLEQQVSSKRIPRPY